MTEWDPNGTNYVNITYPGNDTKTARVLRTPAVEGLVTFPGGTISIKGQYSPAIENGLLLQTTGAGAKIPGGVILNSTSRITAPGSGGVGVAPGTPTNPYVLDADFDDDHPRCRHSADWNAYDFPALGVGWIDK